MNDVNSVGPAGPMTINKELIVKEGWLQKRGEHWKNWRSR